LILSLFNSILFDLDGTLIDSWPAVREAYKTGLRRLQPAMEQSHIDALRSDNREYAEAIKYVFKISEKNPYYEKIIGDIYMENLPAKTLIFPGVEKLIHHLDTIGKPWGIVTTKKRAFVENILSEKSIFDKRKILICGDDVKNKKPDPEGLLNACRELKSLPAQTLYIGDLESDIIAAQNGGLKSACVLYGYAPSVREAMLYWHADYYFNNLDEILRP
jgi:phosphoglycolate phosphatase